VKPIRTIKGSATRMYYVHGVALDKEGNLYVASAGDRINGHETGMRVTVYAPGANGDAAPIRTIEGPDTGLHSPFFLALDGSGNLYVANQARFEGKVTTVVYARGASGDARPVRTLQGPPMHDAGDMGDAVAVDGTGSLYMNDHDGGAALVYAPGAGGNTPPIRTIKGGDTQLRHPRFLAVWPTGPSAPGATAETSPPSPARPARVTAVHLRVEPQSYSGPCPRAIQLVGDITTDGPGEAYYQFQAGAVGANREGALHFDAAGTQSVTSDGQIRRTLLVPSVRFLAGLEPRGHQENAKWADATLDLKCESAK